MITTPKQQQKENKQGSPERSYSSLAYEERKRQSFINPPEPSLSPSVINTNNTRYTRANFNNPGLIQHSPTYSINPLV